MNIDKEFAEQFANHWVEAWNNHDLEAILSHYADDFEMTSPLIAERMGVEAGKLTGKSAVGEYWAKGLAAKPVLHFELIQVFCGVGSLIIHYQGRRGLVAEIFHFNNQGKVFKASAHYD